MDSRLKICIVTGSRAEYGLLYWLLKDIAADPDLKLQIIATGMHLSPEFGLTYRQIEVDGFTIDAKVEMLLSADTPVAVTKSMGLGVIGFADALDRLAPDIIIVLGDRFEIFAAAQAAMVARIPLAHIHGGETSEGAYDEGIRHAISKMAQWHFVATEPYRQRVVQLGEAPQRVFNVGAPGLDHLSRTQLLTREELEQVLDMRLRQPLFVVTYHPVTLGMDSPEKAMKELIAGLRKFEDASIVFTYPNADSGGRALRQIINSFVAEDLQRIRAYTSLGQQRYLSLIRQADVIVGNSSSGLIEAPALKTATVNIGDRQKGRLKASSVIDASEHRTDIAKAIRHALSPEFRIQLLQTQSLYGCGDASASILRQLKAPLPTIQKSFFDIKHKY
ncbi:UDP-N-acetyl-D-glucosamine 2-epimerase, UDP-hydrolysing [Solidesulfovibrio fructosivorans JJ]]|uniref:UDP-N-acetyl-D-glucosamine 2-epimerase, UDP-hydrolysing n=1 Tax=Solidesulfovibrio fructosivorans JJ] TaxID=596151 RepID=E1JXP8_SOLFR|nr:UDP-N-acetylglucosamine 2-epimerase [Solidesulfovibrio fructosivorans]EFL50821.1 UDP-N-acetyl-D-glucosamine 2-epimerase, UDP-hydrolysing [Solidesulfovibrio fructosivorans JJ]]